jgi:predicted transposase YdaD
LIPISSLPQPLEIYQGIDHLHRPERGRREGGKEGGKEGRREGRKVRA